MSVDGMGNFDVVFGEIVMYVMDLNGIVVFSGMFFGIVLFVIKYKVVEWFVMLYVEYSMIVDFDIDDVGFWCDFLIYFDWYVNYWWIEEFGIGMNFGICSLYGCNVGFEECYLGLYFGFGGGENGSYYFDLIFVCGMFVFDEWIVFDGVFVV